jgi:hypothetical protein
VLGLFLTLCTCLGFYFLAARVRRAVGARSPSHRARALTLTPTPRQCRPLEEWAFDFERHSLELTDVSIQQRMLSSRLLSAVVMPLVGHVRLCDVDRDLERGVASVLGAQTGYFQGPYAAELWLGFLHWSRCQAGPPHEATVWEPLIAEVERRARQFRNGE